MFKRKSKNNMVLTIIILFGFLSTIFFVCQRRKVSFTTTVTINVPETIHTVPVTALGVNTAVWDDNLTSLQLPSLLKSLHIEILRYPGGGTADVYHWATNTVDHGYTNPNNNFNNFMKVARKIGAQPIITVNAGDDNTTEAASWVKYANITHRYNVKYWEIGNEMYGNWENGNFANNPSGYAQEVHKYIIAMKAVDPSICIGVDLMVTGTGKVEWNSIVIQTLHHLGTDPDFGIVHWYPQISGKETDAGLLKSTQKISTIMENLNMQLGGTPVFVTETNSVSGGAQGKQTTSLVNALFLDDEISDWIEAGASNVDWWDLFNGICTVARGANVNPRLYGTTNYGDYGLLSNGSIGQKLREPPAGTPFPDYYGYQILGALMEPSAILVKSESSTKMLIVHSSKLPNGNLSVMIINKDPNRTYIVKLNIEGYRVQRTAIKLFYGEGSRSVSQKQVKKTNFFKVPPYSVTELIFQPLHK